jgi:protein involved in polysaccharide export with SLBB domain
MLRTKLYIPFFICIWIFAIFAQEQKNSGSGNVFLRGDALKIMVAPDTLQFINGTYLIDDDGCVFLPVLGKVKVDAMSEMELTTYLNSAYQTYLKYPTVKVQPLMRISLLGGFHRPGFFYVNPTISLWGAIALAGGPIREDGIKKINWERRGSVINKNLLPAIEAGRSLKTLGVQSGDQLWITHIPNRDGWELFTTNVLPIISVSVSALSVVTAFYFFSEANNRGTK